MSKFSSIENRKAKFEYQIVQTYECGIILKGTEVKSILSGHGSLQGSFAKVIKGEIFLFDFYIPNIINSSWNKHNETEPRKLLLKRKEIDKIQNELERHQNYTLVPYKVYYSDSNKIKVELSLCYGRTNYDKREYIKERDSKKSLREY